MELPLIWFGFFLVSLIFLRFYFSGPRCSILGPNFLSVILNFHLFGTTEHHKLLTRWRKKYGNVYQYSFLGRRFIVFNTPDAMKSCFSSDDRTHYPPTGAFHQYTDGAYGVTGSAYTNWLEQRKLVVQALKEFGFRGNEIATQHLSDDLDKIMADLAANCNTALDVQNHLQLPMMNMIWRMTSSSALSPDKYISLLHFQKIFGITLRSKLLEVFGPVLKALKWEPGFVKEYKKSVEEFWEVQEKIIENHLAGHEKGSEPKDFVDSYLNKMKDERLKGTSFDGETGIKNLRATLMDVNIAGAGTVYHTLEWMTLHLLLNPSIQKKIREEVESVVGIDGKITIEDTRRFPYTEACIMEMVREFTPATSVVRINAKDANVDGHFIPAGTVLIGNIWGSNHDERIWPDPFELKPERFLAGGRIDAGKMDLLMSFGAGRRKCLGMLVAKDMLLLLISRMVQRFDILPHPEHPITNLENQYGFLHQAPRYTTLFVDRFSN